MQISIYLLILFLLLALVVGGGIVWFALMYMYKQRARQILQTAEHKAEKVILEAHKAKTEYSKQSEAGRRAD